jgi:hypothetical protein
LTCCEGDVFAGKKATVEGFRVELGFDWEGERMRFTCF